MDVRLFETGQLIWILVVATVLSVVWLLSRLHRRHFFLWQYLYFLRVPVLARLLLLLLALGMLLPSDALWGLPKMLGNLAIASPWEVLVIAVLATWTAHIALFAGNALVNVAENRAALPFQRRADPPRGRLARAILWMHEMSRRPRSGDQQSRWKREARRLLIHGIVAGFLIVVVVIRSFAESSGPPVGSPALSLTTAGVAGFALAVLIPILVRAWVPKVTKAAWLRVDKWAGRAMKMLGRIAPDRLGRSVGRVRSVLQRISHRAAQKLDPTEFLVEEAKDLGIDSEDAQAGARHIKSDIVFLVLYLVLTLLLYGTGALFLNPAMGIPVPPLALILVLVILWTLLLSALCGLLDVYRIPSLLLVPVAMFFLYQAGDIDHQYRAPRVGADTPRGQTLSATDAYRAWRTGRGADADALVVVTASGGGITASLWTARVLAELQTAIPAFGRSLLLVSSVSGGGVGAMYFVGAYRDGRAPTGEPLAAVVDASAASSLAATAWGLVYRDFWRFWPWADQTQDRGWALERTWEARLDRLAGPENPARAALPGSANSLRRWRHDAALGLRPVQVFNATVAETGLRLLLGSMNIPFERRRDLITGGPWGAWGFLDLYANWDISVPTAARLSATFPFVSPIARIQDDENLPRDKRVPQEYLYHVADGGYYDNHGVLTAVDFLRDILPEMVGSDSETPGVGDTTAVGPPAPDGSADSPTASVPDPPERVVIIQIRTREEEVDSASRRQGFKFAMAGPAVTMLNVRGASQISRNDLEIALLEQAWAGSMEIREEVFELCDDGPLSWRLSPAEIRAIRDRGWTPEHAKKVGRVRSWIEGDGAASDRALDCSEMRAP